MRLGGSSARRVAPLQSVGINELAILLLEARLQLSIPRGDLRRLAPGVGRAKAGVVEMRAAGDRGAAGDDGQAAGEQRAGGKWREVDAGEARQAHKDCDDPAHACFPAR
ncbi:hypothetical protein [Bradyrhizobium brasilense]|uniref:hypothetical protein n=1 Tax=Bradyrhizobium brasilense TaxID=1419277 RepID=UPI000B806822|nr:hypothetical protein [Bradyrhizobium brasilense]